MYVKVILHVAWGSSHCWAEHLSYSEDALIGLAFSQVPSGILNKEIIILNLIMHRCMGAKHIGESFWQEKF